MWNMEYEGKKNAECTTAPVRYYIQIQVGRLFLNRAIAGIFHLSFFSASKGKKKVINSFSILDTISVWSELQKNTLYYSIFQSTFIRDNFPL